MSRFFEEPDRWDGERSGHGERPVRPAGLERVAGERTEYPRFHRWMERQLERFDARFSHYRIPVRAAAGRIHRGAVTEFEELSLDDGLSLGDGDDSAEIDHSEANDREFDADDFGAGGFGMGGGDMEDFGIGDFGGGGW